MVGIINSQQANLELSRSRPRRSNDETREQRISHSDRKQKRGRLSDAMMGLATAHIQRTLQVKEINTQPHS